MKKYIYGVHDNQEETSSDEEIHNNKIAPTDNIDDISSDEQPEWSNFINSRLICW